MAIGVALHLILNFLKFNSPYKALNIQDFGIDGICTLTSFNKVLSFSSWRKSKRNLSYIFQILLIVFFVSGFGTELGGRLLFGDSARNGLCY